MEVLDLTIGQARTLIAEYAGWLARRDEIVLSVRAAGMSKVEIMQATGHSRTTIDRILARKDQPR